VKDVQVVLRQFFPELTEEEKPYGWFQQDSATVRTEYMSLQALSNVLETELSASPFGQHVHSILILVLFLLELFEGQSLQQ
jgi:hypothetical protein